MEAINYVPKLNRETKDQVEGQQKAYEASKKSRENFQNAIAGNDFIVKTTESGTKGRLRVRSYDPQANTMNVVDSLENGDKVTEIGNIHDPKPNYGATDPLMMHVSYTKKNGKKHTGYVSADYLVNAQGVSSSNCDKISRDVREAVTKEPGKVLMIIEDALTINESCACEIIKSAIQASHADEQMSMQIVQTAIAVAPKMTGVIIECAQAVGANVSIEQVTFEDQAGKLRYLPPQQFDFHDTTLRTVLLELTKYASNKKEFTSVLGTILNGGIGDQKISLSENDATFVVIEKLSKQYKIPLSFTKKGELLIGE